ncbi:MAG TPA: hypothetical protein VK886_09175 [Vicinamibacterales bacterium]|nr:hypothetical protein [Vicinamibacterales bacterium]
MISLQPAQPIIVRVFEEPVKETTVVDVLLGSIGLTGVVLVVAAVAGLALGALLVWMKKRRGADALVITAQTLELSPTEKPH